MSTPKKGLGMVCACQTRFRSSDKFERHRVECEHARAAAAASVYNHERRYPERRANPQQVALRGRELEDNMMAPPRDRSSDSNLSDGGRESPRLRRVSSSQNRRSPRRRSRSPARNSASKYRDRDDRRTSIGRESHTPIGTLLKPIFDQFGKPHLYRHGQFRPGLTFPEGKDGENASRGQAATAGELVEAAMQMASDIGRHVQSEFGIPALYSEGGSFGPHLNFGGSEANGNGEEGQDGSENDMMPLPRGEASIHGGFETDAEASDVAGSNMSDADEADVDEGTH